MDNSRELLTDQTATDLRYSMVNKWRSFSRTFARDRPAGVEPNLADTWLPFSVLADISRQRLWQRVVPLLPAAGRPDMQCRIEDSSPPAALHHADPGPEAQ